MTPPKGSDDDIDIEPDHETVLLYSTELQQFSILNEYQLLATPHMIFSDQDDAETLWNLQLHQAQPPNGHFDITIVVERESLQAP